jgi:hypothetical protein
MVAPIARLSDAGLLGARLDELKEFDDVRRWTLEAFRIGQ